MDGNDDDEEAEEGEGLNCPPARGKRDGAKKKKTGNPPELAQKP